MIAGACLCWRRSLKKSKPTSERPRVLAHFAMSADGKISTRNFTPSQFTSPRDKARLGDIRAECDAVLAGRGTVAADAMSMGLSSETLRAARVAEGRSAMPVRVVVSNAGKLSKNWKVFQYQESPLIVFSTVAMTEATRAEIAPYCDLHLFARKVIPLAAMLAILRKEYRVRKLVCEGGGRLLRSLVEAGVVDEICLTIAPIIFGGVQAPTLIGSSREFLPELTSFRLVEHQSVEGELFLRFRR